MSQRNFFPPPTKQVKVLCDFQPGEIVDRIAEAMKHVLDTDIEFTAVKADTYQGELQVSFEVPYHSLYSAARQLGGPVQMVPLGNRDMFILVVGPVNYRLVAYRTRSPGKIDGLALPEPNFEGD